MKLSFVASLLFGTLALAGPPMVRRFEHPAIHLPEDSITSNKTSFFEKRAEVTTCYNIGTTANRDLFVQGIAAFCAYQIGKSYPTNTEFYVRERSRLSQHAGAN
jgi:hypothetical protein